MKKPDLYRRAYNYAQRHWKLEVFIHGGTRLALPWELCRYIRDSIAAAWRAGYKAGRASK